MARTLYFLPLPLLLCLSPFAATAVQSHRSHLPAQQQQEPPDEPGLRQQRGLARKLNKKRQEALQRDTDKLLQLATELKEYVDKSNENLLSVDVIKKSDEIEKLAHSVKDKMKGF